MVPSTEVRWCGVCAADAVFDRFDCTEHDDCLELACSGCGAGLERAGRLDPIADEPGSDGAGEVAA